MKIRDKLFLGFGLYILTATVMGFFAYRELRSIMTRISLVETADDITNSILEVRRHEKNFLLYKDEANLEELKKYLNALKGDIDNIKAEIIVEIGMDNYDMMKHSLNDYERLFDTLRDNLQSQQEMEGLIRVSGQLIEHKSTGKELQNFLLARRYEKGLMLYKNQSAYHSLKQALAMQNNGDDELHRYITFSDKLFLLYEEENRLMDRIRRKARQIQSFTGDISKHERQNIGKMLRNSLHMLVSALLVILALGTAVNIKLATSIAVPIRRLERFTKKVASGEFPRAIEIRGNDEIASLEASFNQMGERLKEALDSLEEIIKKLKEKQSQLVEAEKLASIGVLAAGVAHEINNPLTSVLTFSNLILEQMPGDDPRRQRLKMIADETRKARSIVRQLLNFARETPLKPIKININRPIINIVESLDAQGLFKDIEVVLNLDESLPEIKADPGLIGQVILNILLNAVHAITPPGRIEVATRASGNFIEMIFSDMGCGIPADRMKKIFDPFFTTKDSEKGVGLGLAVSYGIIKKHGGEIEVKSTVGKGSAFIVRLPLNG
jgi:signal transduction histidine kinase